MNKTIVFFLFALFLFTQCQKQGSNIPSNVITDRVGVELKSDLVKNLSSKDKQLLRVLFKISDYIDSMFFYENFGDINELLSQVQDSTLRKAILINFGPWNIFTNQSFIKGYPKRPEGGNYYPKDITKDEFLKFNDVNKYSHYTFIRRDSSGKLYCVYYHAMFKNYIDTIYNLFYKAASLTDDTLFAEFLKTRAEDFKTDNYDKSDSLWVKLKDNKIDFLVGPIYIEADNLFYLKADHIAVVLKKDSLWSMKVKKYNIWLKYLQKALPVPDEYKEEEPSDISSLYVYDAIYFGGSAKGSAMLLSLIQPMDPKKQLKYGVKNLQFKNVIQYKFDKIAKPIGELILDKKQLQYLNSDAFFINTLLWEIGGSLGVKKVINSNKSVRDALKENYIITEYIKSNVMTLYLAQRLKEVDEIQNDLKDNYTTFIIDIIRGLRFGIKNNYAIANLITINYLIDSRALKIDYSGKIHINYDKIQAAITELLQKIIILQGDGNYEETKKFIKKYNIIPPQLHSLLEKLNKTDIPKDIYPIQGEKILGI